MSNIFKEIKYLIYLIFFACLAIMTLIVPLLLFQYIERKAIIYTAIGLAIYLIIVFILKRIFKKKIFSTLLKIPFYPLFLYLDLLTYIIPINLLIINTFLYFSVPIILISFLNILLLFFNIEINIELKIYLSFVIFYVFISCLNKLLIFYLAKASPARDSTSIKLKPYNIKEISEYLLSADNMKLLIYSFNFICIIIINIAKFQNLDIYNYIAHFERPLLQSLVTFIAFDRILSLIKNHSFKPSIFYGKVSKGIKDKLEDLKKYD